MALSQTSLEIDTLTVETLFNRGSLLSTTQAYVPVMSSIGGFSQWINQPVSSIYYPFFWSYTNPIILLEPANRILKASEQLSTSLYYNTDVLSTFNSFNYSTLIVLSNIDSSTVSTYRSTYSNDNIIALDRNAIITDKLSEDLPGLLLTSTMFRTDNFSYNASSLIIVGSNYYKNGAPRYIGAGLSSMYNFTLNNNSNDNLSTYRGILDNSSNNSSTLKQVFRERRLVLTDLVTNLAEALETGSSFSTLYAYSNSSFLAHVSSLSSSEFFFDTYINSFSTSVDTVFNQYIIPTLGPDISTSLSSLIINNSTLISSLISSITPSTLSIPLLIFSTSFGLRLRQQLSTLTPYNYISGFSSINFRFSTILNPIFDPLSVSTNLLGYQYISTNSQGSTIISSLSTLIPELLTSGTISSLRLLNSNISSILSSVNFNTSTIIGMAYPYVTAPGISSFSTLFASQIKSTIVDYGDRISSILLPFYLNLSNVNSIPGLSTLAKAGSNIDVSLSIQLPEITQFVNIDYPNFEIGFLSSYNINYINLSTQINSNTKNFIKIGLDEYSSIYLQYLEIFLPTVTIVGKIYDVIQEPSEDFPEGGLIYQANSNFSTLEHSTNIILDDVIGSNSLFTELRIIPDYSTSIYSLPPGVENPIQYLLRSTFFITVQASTFNYQTPNFNVSTLCVGTSSSSYKLEVNGGTSITPYSIDTNYFLLGNTSTNIYSEDGNIISLNDPHEINEGSGNYYLNYVFGTAIFENSMIITGYNATTENYRSQLIPLNKSGISTFEYFDNSGNLVFNSPISFSFEFYTLPAGYETGVQGFDPTIGNIQSFYRAPYYFHFQIPFQFPLANQRTNYIMYTSNILSNNYIQTGFNDVVTPLDTYISLGPVTSFTTNGSYYLLTATSNTYNNYYSNMWNPILYTSYYTLFVTSNIDFLNLQNEQFSTPMISDPPVELHDSLWTGKNWLVAGDGVYTSQDALSWNQVLPTSTERLLHYRSMDFNGQDIMLAHVSSSPRYIEFLKSSDYGNTWAKTSTISLPNNSKTYTDVGLSSIVYSVNLKWTFNAWSAYVNSFDGAYAHIFKSANNGITWTDINTGSSSIPDRDTANVLFQPIENIKPSIELPNFHIYARDDPVRNPTTNTLSVRFSSIIFNEGDFTVKRRYNSLLRGLMGINTIYPTYSLDIAIGDARKPSGTLWINPSDCRIKTNIINADSEKIASELTAVRLVKYKWKELYRITHHLSAEPTFGFISQEIEPIYPSSIHYSEESGFADFRTLDTDQLFKAKIGLTQYLLKRASTLQSRIDMLLRASI